MAFAPLVRVTTPVPGAAGTQVAMPVAETGTAAQPVRACPLSLNVTAPESGTAPAAGETIAVKVTWSFTLFGLLTVDV